MQRWIALIGQVLAVMLVHHGFGFKVPMVELLVLIGASAALNAVAQWQLMRTRWLDDFKASLFLGFDILQLAAMLYYTGGLQNPFALLMLAPLSVSAAVLRRSEVVGLTVLAVVCLSMLSIWHLPLPWSADFIPPPRLYLFGGWVALTLACAFIAFTIYSVAREAGRLNAALVHTEKALSREQKAAAVGALAAAAAHELGSPLGTISLLIKEMAHDVPPDSPYAEDLEILVGEVDRCRQILSELSQRPDDDDPFRLMKLTTLVDAISAPWRGKPGDDGQEVLIEVTRRNPDTATMPIGERSPELVHGLGNIIQNAAQFAASRVLIECDWDDELVHITIRDDGPGFPPGFLSRLGDPFASTRKGKDGHMGLGVFIAQTLIGNTGGTLRARNDEATGGAVVACTWGREAFEKTGETTGDGLLMNAV
ncbi:MAG: ActS/PrrB/RegB family redox-sensitive histidine kinase [Alphaproteobacteria bacterium]